jgi:5-methylcytosine-specific restriction protein B
MLDYALRRRFAFFEMPSGFDTAGFIKYQQTLDSQQFNKLINCVKELNAEIEKDDNLGSGFCIGHSYFCNLKKETSVEVMSDIIETELIPLLKEYWFDEPQKVNEWSRKLRNSIQ